MTHCPTGPTDADLTLPSVVASLAGRYRELRPVLTLVFHPDTGRIGESAAVPSRRGRLPWTLGRTRPQFGSGRNEAGRALADPHVSRRSVEFDYVGDQLVLRRVTGSSRVRVAGRELRDQVTLDQEQLLAGVPLLLGHAIVLLLRLVDSGRDEGDSCPDRIDRSLRGRSAYMQDLRRQIARVAATDQDVLIQGETGSGKELVAAAIHAASARARGPLVSVNMAAIPEELAPAALFGSARGAFTGAARDRDGYFQQAQGGSLFLDEIGDTPVAVQPQLLRALQQREVQSVGGRISRADLRVISATDAALDGEGCDFKAALRHRLAACEIQLRPLREHPEDIGELLLYFLESDPAGDAGNSWQPANARGAPQVAAWAELFYSFVSYHWPGNVRQLANFARQVAMASERELTLPDTVAGALAAGAVEEAAAEPGPEPGSAAKARQPLRNMQEVSAAEFERVWQACRFEVAGTARRLAVSRQSVYRRLEESAEYRLAGQVPVAELRRALQEQGGDVAAAALVLRVSLAGLRARLRQLAAEV